MVLFPSSVSSVTSNTRIEIGTSLSQNEASLSKFSIYGVGSMMAIRSYHHGNLKLVNSSLSIFGTQLSTWRISVLL